MPYNHIPVMCDEIVHHLNCQPGHTYVDCTIGGAGHSKAILDNIIPDGLLIGIDQDLDAIQNAKTVLRPYEPNVRLFHDNFVHLPELLAQLNISAVDGILIDLGLSLHQIESSGRGFSFKKDEPLDMRMNIHAAVQAKDMINTLDEKKMADLFFKFGEERYSRQIARKIVTARTDRPITTSMQLADIVCDALSVKAMKKQKIHPATRVFMALRIAVNKEIERLEIFMKTAIDLLNPAGRICVISFHSLEDRIVKHTIKDWEKACTCPPGFPKCVCGKKILARSLTAKVVRPSAKELDHNPMARSAKLRVAEKL